MRIVILICILIALILVGIFILFKRTTQNSIPIKCYPNKFVILNSKNEWLYLDRNKYKFTTNKDMISIFIITEKGNIITQKDEFVYEMGLNDNNEIINDKTIDCKFEIVNKYIKLYTQDKCFYLTDNLELTDECTNNNVHVEYISCTDSI